MNNLQPVHVKLRQKICGRCPAQCAAFLDATIRPEDAATVCPLNRWPKIRARTVGLGDVVEAVAKPVARMIDAVAKTDLVHCIPCSQNKARLNKKVPDVLKLFRK